MKRKDGFYLNNYKFDFAEHGFMTIKIRMNWDFRLTWWKRKMTATFS